jgi:pimaricinolide synthase PimS1
VAAVWGLVRGAQAEYPERFALLDLDPQTEERAPVVSWSLSMESGEPQLALRGGRVLVPRLVPFRAPAAPAPGGFDPQGTVLITGASGGLGRLVACHLARVHRARHLLLASRSGPRAEGMQALVDELEQLGCAATVAACDAADRAQLARLLDSIPAERPLTVVIHAAGIVDDATIASLSTEQLERVLRPKVDAVVNLHELTEGLAELVLFSSLAGTVGGGGQANYAAANAFLDAFARLRHVDGLPAVSLGWGMWEEGMGMLGALDGAALARLRRVGVSPLSTEDALRLLDRARSCGEPLLAPALLDAAALRAQARMGVLPAVLRSLVRIPARRAPTVSGAGTLAIRLAGAPREDWEQMAFEVVSDCVAGVLGVESSGAIAKERNFTDLGFDSLTAVELRNVLQQATGIRLPATLVFDHPTPVALARMLCAKVGGTAAAARSSGDGRRSRAEEPIAIVAMSCRFPGGVRSPQELWELVAGGVDAIGGFPSDRGWKVEDIYDPDLSRPGTCCTREGGFLYDACEFDAELFGITPREAVAMDPQQRLLLEGAWEAFEAAGLDPYSLKGSQTGVFVGTMYQNYGLSARVGLSEHGSLVGVGGSLVSGRVAYVFGLEGPAVTIDTACSSSLVALHLACQALRGGECSLALAGGVTVFCEPDPFILFSRAHVLSADGRCRAFAEGANGVGWSEGVGLVLLERLSDARRLGHEALAIVRGSAVNQDGASNGLTAPNGPSQERVIRQALAAAGLSPAEVDAVEAHGTGTPLGDPIEAQALLSTYGQERGQTGPLWLGSVKSNIGHTQAAAGIAGVIKMVMAMRHGVLPKTLHVDPPSSHVDWSQGDVSLLVEPTPWRPTHGQRRAGVSSFGVSGTNAHVILEQAPAPESQPAAVAPPRARERLFAVTPWPISGAGANALSGQARRLSEFAAAQPEIDDLDLAHALARRGELAERAVVLGRSREQLLGGLTELARGRPTRNVVRGSSVHAGRLAFLFSGMGGHRVGMGAGLHQALPEFRSCLEQVCECLDVHLEHPLLALMVGESEQEGIGLDDLTFAQPAMFALQVSLFRLMHGWGVRPDFLMGHSLGELAAAHVAGVLNLEDACALVAARGRLMSTLAPVGIMAAVQASEAEMRHALGDREGPVQIAAVNSPRSVVLSGERQAVVQLVERWKEQGRKARLLELPGAGHSHMMDPILERFAAVASGLSLGEPRLQIISGVTGELLSAELACSPDYWVRHVREPVRFYDGVRTLLGLGVDIFLELGCDAVLSAMCAESLAEGERASAVPALRGDRPEDETVLAALAEIWVRGGRVDWGAALSPAPGRQVRLPTYAFQRERYWLDGSAETTSAGDAAAIGQADIDHPLLQAATELADDSGWLFTGRVSLREHAWLVDHAVRGVPLLAGTAFLDLAVCAGRKVGCASVRELMLHTPLVLPELGGLQLQLRIGACDERAQRPIGVYARTEPLNGEQPPWTEHASGLLAPADGTPLAVGEELAVWPPLGAHPIGLDRFYERMGDLGFEYGPAFRGLRSAWQRGEWVFAEVALPEPQADEVDGYSLHPALLDAALHSLIASMGTHTQENESAELRLPFAWEGVQIYRTGARGLRVCLEPAGWQRVSLTVADERGEPLARVDSLRARAVSSGQLGSADATGRRMLYSLDWIQTALGAGLDVGQAGAVLVGCREQLAERLRTQGGMRVRVHRDLGALRAAIQDEPVPPELVLLDCTAQSETCGERQDGARERERAPLQAELDARLRDLLGSIQGWLAEERLAGSRLVVLTRGAANARAEEDVGDLMGAAIWGLVRSVQTENPGRVLLVDLDDREASWRALAAALAAAIRAEESQLALRSGTMLVPRLTRARHEAAVELPPLGDGTVLITGGTGGLGRLFARHLVSEHGASALLLVSRRGPSAPGASKLQAELKEMGADVRIAVCDVSDRAQLEQLIQSVSTERPLCGVIHAAVALDEGLIGSLGNEQLQRVLAPKAHAALSLHELTQELDMRLFVLMSSFAGLFGNPGQAPYAAANALLDALAARRRAQGMVASSLAWGLWEQATELTAGVGEEHKAMAARMGLRALSDEQGLRLFDLALESGQALSIPANLDSQAIGSLAGTGWMPPLLRGLVPSETSVRIGGDALSRRLAGASRQERADALLELVRGEVADLLGQPSGESVDVERPLLELGLDSLTAVELRNRLGLATGLQLPVSLVFDRPAPRDIAAHLSELLERAPSERPSAEAPPAAPPLGTLGSLLRQARARGKLAEPMELLTAAASLRPTFGVEQAGERAPELVKLSQGPATPALLCVPSLLASSGPHQYVAFARAFAKARDVFSLSLVGFSEDGPVPATVEAAIETHVHALRRHGGDTPVVLAGHSTGGMLAIAIAARLEQLGAAVAGVVLVDTYALVEGHLETLMGVAIDGMLERAESYGAISDTRLMAMATYASLFAAWQAPDIRAPTLLLQASEPMPGLSVKTMHEQAWRPVQNVVELPGDHFSVMEDHAEAAAQATERWLADIADR